MLIDKSDAHRVGLRKWHVGSDGYYYTSAWDGERTYHVSLHHYLVGRPLPPKEIDHKNRNPKDNRKNNLHIVTKSQNIRNRRKCSRNTSGYTGVNRFEINGKYIFWRALGYSGEHLGCFKTRGAALKVRRDYETRNTSKV